MGQPLVLAIEPDLRQAAIVKRIVREQALAEVAVVDTRDAAIEAMRTCMPDVLLLSALMSPRDEDELIAHLKTLENAGHLQTHTIPQLASTLGPGEERASRGLLSAFRRKKDPAPVAGCDPDLFAEEIRVFLQRAADKKSQLQNTDFTAPDMRPSAKVSARDAAENADEPTGAPSSSWSSPFEWKPAGSSSRSSRAREEAPRPAADAPPVAAMPAVAPPEAPPVPISVVAALEAAPAEIPVAEPIASEPLVREPLVVAAPEPQPEPVAAPVVEPPAPVVAEPIARREPVAAVKPAPAKPPAPEPTRPKPVADRGAKVAARVPYQGLVREHVNKNRENRDRLGPLARWARADAARPAKSAPVTGDDVRTLISSLAVPAAVASVTYPSGCRIRRVRVPASPDHDGGDGIGPVILSRQKLADQRDKQASAQ